MRGALLLDPANPALAPRVEAAGGGQRTKDGEGAVEERLGFRIGSRVRGIEVARYPGQVNDLRGLHVDAVGIVTREALTDRQRLVPCGKCTGIVLLCL